MTDDDAILAADEWWAEVARGFTDQWSDIGSVDLGPANPEAHGLARGRRLRAAYRPEDIIHDEIEEHDVILSIDGTHLLAADEDGREIFRTALPPTPQPNPGQALN